MQTIERSFNSFFIVFCCCCLCTKLTLKPFSSSECKSSTEMWCWHDVIDNWVKTTITSDCVNANKGDARIIIIQFVFVFFFVPSFGLCVMSIENSHSLSFGCWANRNVFSQFTIVYRFTFGSSRFAVFYRVHQHRLTFFFRSRLLLFCDDSIKIWFLFFTFFTFAF